MEIYDLIMVNTIVLVIALLAICALMALWVRAEWKLAKHNESCFFRRKDKQERVEDRSGKQCKGCGKCK